ncbi:hypothetical protein [Rhizobium sp. A37_96]
MNISNDDKEKIYSLLKLVFQHSFSGKLVTLGCGLIAVGKWDVIQNVATLGLQGYFKIPVADDKLVGVPEAVGIALIVIGLISRFFWLIGERSSKHQVQRTEDRSEFLQKYRTMSGLELQVGFERNFGIPEAETPAILALLAHPTNQAGALRCYRQGARYLAFDGVWFRIRDRWLKWKASAYFLYFCFIFILSLGLLFLGTVSLSGLLTGTSTESGTMLLAESALTFVASLFAFRDCVRINAALSLVRMRPA